MLLVEDVLVSQRIGKAALSKAKPGYETGKDLKYKVEVAADGKKAVELFEAGEFDIVLMDINLPLMDGVDAAKAIRLWEEKSQRSKCLIFGLTGSLSNEDLDRYKSAGMNGCIAKGTVLVDALHDAIADHSKNPEQFVVSRVSQQSTAL
mgnify:CR=1 FL=1